jgi:hypothetical protein
MEKKTQKQQESTKFVAMELSAVKIQQLSKQPIVESLISMSEDGKWVIHKTIITDIKPKTYLEAVLGNNRD